MKTMNPLTALINTASATNTKHFYAVDRANEDQTIHAFASKVARDGFVDNGNRRFSKTHDEANALCSRIYECSATDAVAKGFI